MDDFDHLSAALSLTGTLHNNVEHHDEVLRRVRRFLVGKTSITASDLAIVLRCTTDEAKCWLKSLGDYIIAGRGWYRLDRFKLDDTIKNLASKSAKRPGSAKRP